MTMPLSLREDEFHEQATSQTGYDDFGDSSYRTGLHVLLEAYEADRPLGDQERESVAKFVVTLLSARLYTQRGWATNPQALQLPIARPVVVTGLPRSGTTALHRLMSVDPQFQGLEYWLSRTPMPRPPRETWQTCKEYRECVARLESSYSKNPSLRAIHHIAADQLEECGLVLRQNFVHRSWVVQSPLPSYARWFETQSTYESYRRYADVLRLIGCHEPFRTWLVKTPGHMFDIDQLLAVFPDACVIHTHRDPLVAIPSLCSLLFTAERTFGNEQIDRTIAPWQAECYRQALTLMDSVRQQVPERFFDVDYQRLVAEPIEVLHETYEYFGLTLTREVESRMRAWIAEHPAKKHGTHAYPLEDWGISSQGLARMFAEYRAAHHFS